MQSLIGQKEPMAAALFEHKHTLEVSSVYGRVQGEKLTGKRARTTDGECVSLISAIHSYTFISLLLLQCFINILKKYNNYYKEQHDEKNIWVH